MKIEDFRPSKVDVGWYVDEPQAKFVFAEPTPLFRQRHKPLSGRAVQACPAINELERDYFAIKNPFDIRLRCLKNGDGYDLHVVDEGTRIDYDLVSRFVYLMEPKLWRSPSSPVIQIRVPYFFLCDEPCYMTMLAPYMSASSASWPGLFIGGRLPISIWPRTLNWAFEWTDLDTDLKLRRGNDLCYLYFETNALRSKISLHELEYTKELDEFRKGITSTPKYMSNTFSLFETALERRPEKLVKRKAQ
ncbi:hypothetical protein [Phaeobacter sp. NW0010-22]|uniref:hypothetical protein n=1 Tax=Phaeobacter sp. NW0010-22 TaxID=3135907 RepID=UPI003109B5D2